MTAPFRCPVEGCGAVSYHPEDIRHGYCGSCRWWTRDPVLREQRAGARTGPPVRRKLGPGFLGLV